MPAPVPTPETADFWDGTAVGEIRLQQCAACVAPYFPPQPFCPRCGSDDLSVVVASGRATLVSWVVSYLPAPGFDAPYVIAVVALAEGPQLLTNIVGSEPDELTIDEPLEAVFEPQDGYTLVRFAAAARDGAGA